MLLGSILGFEVRERLKGLSLLLILFLLNMIRGIKGFFYENNLEFYDVEGNRKYFLN